MGRGLGSLLSGGADGTLPQEKASPVERVVVDGEKEETKKVAPPAPIKEKKEEKPAEEAKVESAEVYSSKEDNITIKSVTERSVQPAAPQTPAPKPQSKEELRYLLKNDLKRSRLARTIFNL